MSINVEDNSIIASVEESLVAKPTLDVAIVQDFAFVSTSEAPMVTSEMR